MPHLAIQYTSNLEGSCDIGGLCRLLSGTLLDMLDDEGGQLFPTGGTRVLAFPALHHVVADGRDHGFVYLNLRIAKGRSPSLAERVGSAVMQSARAHLLPRAASRQVAITLHIDENHEIVNMRHALQEA